MNQSEFFYDLEQCSQEWFKARLGKITGSSIHKLFSADSAREKYLYTKANEIVTQEYSDSDNFTNVHIERGRFFEETACEEYVIKTFSNVKKVGLVQLGKYVACSPDGLVDEDGLIEIKVLDSNNHFQQMLRIKKQGRDAIAKEHYWQMQFNMYVCNREWCDYVLYSPQHLKNNAQLYIYRLEKDPEAYSCIETMLKKSTTKIEQYINEYNLIINNL